jgi:hypothetical protein
MKTYMISEVAYYKIQANSEEEAEEKLLESEDMNKFFHHVEDREVWEADTELN